MVATLQGTQAQTGSCRALFQKECVHWYPWTGLDNTCQPGCQACLKWNLSNCRKCLANCIKNLTALKSSKLQKLVGLTVCTVLWNALVLTHRHYKRSCFFAFFAFFLFAHVLLGLRPRSTFAKKCWLHLIGLRPSRTRERRSDDLITRTDTLRPVLLPYEYTSDGDAIVWIHFGRWCYRVNTLRPQPTNKQTNQQYPPNWYTGP